MIFYDVTKAGAGGHRSGLRRVSTRLGDELGGAATAVRWDKEGWCDATSGTRVEPAAGDWLLTGELFAEEERPGFTAWQAGCTCRTAAIFHDAIPLQLPQITWPRSVARHPGYMKLLAGFDRVWAVSDTSRQDLLGYWRWLGLAQTPPLATLALGADFDGQPRRPVRPGAEPVLLCVGILEPRKNQEFLLDVCEALWGEGVEFTLHLVGRVNPHFGRPLRDRVRRLQRTQRGLRHHAKADDAMLGRLYAQARASVFPTRAEGCGLPLLESLWQGVPCVCSDLPVLRENAGGGGCVPVGLNDPGAWRETLRRILTDQVWAAELATAAATRTLPTWAETAETVKAGLAK
ncbi:MAG: glycosyltransferase [Opitutaceae bacterium]|nr:glycosyltransferase [Opitutaceae bacterium]